MRQREKIQAMLCHDGVYRALTHRKSTYDCCPTACQLKIPCDHFLHVSRTHPNMRGPTLSVPDKFIAPRCQTALMKSLTRRREFVVGRITVYLKKPSSNRK